MARHRKPKTAAELEAERRAQYLDDLAAGFDRQYEYNRSRSQEKEGDSRHPLLDAILRRKKK